MLHACAVIKTVVRTVGRVRGFRDWPWVLHHVLTLWLWVSYLASLKPNVIRQTRIILSYICSRQIGLFMEDT